MHKDIIHTGPGFWNIRGSFKIGGLVEIGTQASLVQMDDGSFVILDSYSFPPDVKAEVDALIGGSDNLCAVINTHPFHTLHSEWMHVAYPRARHYGTARHKRLYPNLPWQEMLSEDPALWQRVGPELEFTIPDGVDFISENETVHTSSILVYHRPSGSLHVDDTFTYMGDGALVKVLGMGGKLVVHPALSKALKHEAGAAQAFRAWGADLADRWGGAKWICTAHMGALGPDHMGGQTAADHIRLAMSRAEKVLAKHQAKYG